MTTPALDNLMTPIVNAMRAARQSNGPVPTIQVQIGDAETIVQPNMQLGQPVANPSGDTASQDSWNLPISLNRPVSNDMLVTVATPQGIATGKVTAGETTGTIALTLPKGFSGTENATVVQVAPDGDQNDPKEASYVTNVTTLFTKASPNVSLNFPNQTSSGITIADTTTGQPVPATVQSYTGPVADLQEQYINIASDNLNISVSTPNWFIHSGSGEDAIAVNSGTNVLDGGTGSNFLTGGSGIDTFFVDDRGPNADIWSTVVGFRAGDAATIWGVTPQDFGLAFVDGQGAAGFTGLTLHATASGRPTASLTLAGFTQADVNNGRLSVTFGTDTASGSAFMFIHGNS